MNMKLFYDLAFFQTLCLSFHVLRGDCRCINLAVYDAVSPNGIFQLELSPNAVSSLTDEKDLI